MEGRKYSSAMTIFNLLFQFLFNPTLHAETSSVIKRKKTFFWKNFLNLVQSAEIDVQIRLHNKLQSYKVASLGNTTSILDPQLFLILDIPNTTLISIECMRTTFEQFSVGLKIWGSRGP